EAALNVGRNTVEIVVTAEGGAAQTYTLDIVRDAAPQSTSTTPAPLTRPAKVVAGTDDDAVQVNVTRTINASGQTVDAVTLQGAKADEIVAKAAADGIDMPRIIIDDLPEQPADVVEF